MLVGAEVIHDFATRSAMDHISVKATAIARFEGPEPCHRFAPEAVHISVILDLKGDVARCFGKHNAPPYTDIKERQRVHWTVPNFVHYPTTDARDLVLTGETKTLLDLWVEFLESVSEGQLIN